MKRIKELYLKYKEIINYIIVGGCTTLVSIASYYLFRLFISNYVVCTVLSWIAAVTFAYFTNRKFVFESQEKNIFKELVSFFGCRIASLLLEIGFMALLVDCFSVNDRLSKIIVQFIILITNYLLSKLLVFRHKKVN